MNVLVDIVHPAHVHFFRHIVAVLEARGHRVLIVARDKDVTLSLLRHHGLRFRTIGAPAGYARLGQLTELARRVRYLYWSARDWGAEIILTRNPAGAQAAWLLGIPSIFDTDDGRGAGVHFHAALPFASRITTPACLGDDYGPRHLKYPGFKQSTYLHPDLFKPDPAVLGQLGIGPGEPFYLVRFVAMRAVHDRGEAGMTESLKNQVIARLSQSGRVLVSIEGQPSQLPVRDAETILVPPHLMHHLLAHARLLVGDSQTMAAEAAMLGVPNLRMSSFVGRLSYLEHLEHHYGLTHGFHPEQSLSFLAKLDALLANPRPPEQTKALLKRLWAEQDNVVDWFVRLTEELGQTCHARPRFIL